MPPWSVLILHDFRIQAWPNRLVKLLVPVPMAASGLHLLSHFDDIVRLSSLTVGISAANTGSHQVSHLREAVHDRPIGNTWRCGSERGFQSIPGWWSLGWIQDNARMQRRAKTCTVWTASKLPSGARRICIIFLRTLTVGVHPLWFWVQCLEATYIATRMTFSNLKQPKLPKYSYIYNYKYMNLPDIPRFR